MHRTGCKSAILLQIATKSQKNTLDARDAEHALWPVVACCGLLCCQEVFTCFHSQLAVQFPGQPRLQGSNAQPVFEPHFRAADKTNASCHPSQLGAELLLEFWWNFGALYTVFTRYTLHTLHHLVSVVSP